MFKIVDTHAHLAEFENLSEVIQRANEAGVSAIVAAGMSLESNIRTLEIGGDFRSSPVRVLPCLGLHPWALANENVEATILQMRQNLQQADGIGEVGLDYWVRDARKDPVIKQAQQRAFREALELARQFNKPVTVHSRGAWQDCFDIGVSSGARKVIFHWYSGPMPLLKRIIHQGFYVSAGPAVRYSKDHRAAILETPLESLLLETDCPVKYMGIPSEPKDVVSTLSEVSKLKGVKERSVADATTRNFLGLYALRI